MAYELKSEQVTVCGEVLTVWEASNLMDTQRDFMVAEAEAMWKEEHQPKEGVSPDLKTEAAHYLATLLYPSLVACTTGNVPSLDEFIDKVPARETAVWVQAARSKNQRWFLSSNAQTEEDLEKKGVPQTSSSPD